MPLWHRLAVVGVVMLITVVVARLIDRRIARRDLAPESITRYRVVRRSVTTAIVVVASQRTLGNFVAGLLIAFTQPLRLGDEVVIEGTPGVVEEIGLIYTFVRTENDDRLVSPNEQ